MPWSQVCDSLDAVIVSPTPAGEPVVAPPVRH
jgi:hypothetical protein